MRFIEACGIILIALFLLPAAIGIFDELTGIVTDNLELTAELELLLDAYPLFLIVLPIIIIIMLFKRQRGGIDEEE